MSIKQVEFPGRLHSAIRGVSVALSNALHEGMHNHACELVAGLEILTEQLVGAEPFENVIELESATWFVVSVPVWLSNCDPYAPPSGGASMSATIQIVAIPTSAIGKSCRSADTG